MDIRQLELPTDAALHATRAGRGPLRSADEHLPLRLARPPGLYLAEGEAVSVFTVCTATVGPCGLEVDSVLYESL